MQPTQDQVRYVAKLARLYLTEEEVILYQSQLADIFTLFDKLNVVDVSAISEPQHASRAFMNLRKDEVFMPDDAATILAVSKQENIGGHIAIPAIMKKK